MRTILDGRCLRESWGIKGRLDLEYLFSFYEKKARKAQHPILFAHFGHRTTPGFSAPFPYLMGGSTDAVLGCAWPDGDAILLATRMHPSGANALNAARAAAEFWHISASPEKLFHGRLMATHRHPEDPDRVALINELRNFPTGRVKIEAQAKYCGADLIGVFKGDDLLYWRLRGNPAVLFASKADAMIAVAMLVNTRNCLNRKKARRNTLQSYQKTWARRDPKAPDYLGWRGFRWDDELKKLCSPIMRTIWPEDGILVVDAGHKVQEEDDADEWGSVGIHAARLPLDWRRAGTCGAWANFGYSNVSGIVERFGQCVIGSKGWRAEKVAIRALLAPSQDVGLAIEQAYPGIPVYYAEDYTPDRAEAVKTEAKTRKKEKHEPSERH